MQVDMQALGDFLKMDNCPSPKENERREDLPQERLPPWEKSHKWREKEPMAVAKRCKLRCHFLTWLAVML